MHARASSQSARCPVHALTERPVHWRASFRCGEIAHQDQPPSDPERVKYELIKFDMQTSPQKQRPVFNPRNYEKCNVKRSVGDPIAILIKTPSSRKYWVLRSWVRRTTQDLPISWVVRRTQNENPRLSSMCDAISIVIIENVDSDRTTFVSIWPCHVSISYDIETRNVDSDRSLTVEGRGQYSYRSAVRHMPYISY